MQFSGGKGRPPPTTFSIRKLESLGYRMVKKNCRKFQPAEQGAPTSQTDRRRTDRQTDLRQHIANVNVSSRPLKIKRGCQTSNFGDHPKTYSIVHSIKANHLAKFQENPSVIFRVIPPCFTDGKIKAQNLGNILCTCYRHARKEKPVLSPILPLRRNSLTCIHSNESI